MGNYSQIKHSVTKAGNTLIQNKTFLHFMIVVCLFNLIGYIMMREYNAIILGLLTGGIISRFSKNKTVILASTLFIVNFFIVGSLVKEGMKGMKKMKKKRTPIKKKVLGGKIKEAYSEADDEDETDDTEEQEVIADDARRSSGRSKKSDQSIDYAATVETAYDDLNNILGSDGIKNLTNDTQNLVSQQKQLAEAMQGMEPLIKNFAPLMDQATTMMKTMGNTGGLDKLVSMAKGSGVV